MKRPTWYEKVSFLVVSSQVPVILTVDDGSSCSVPVTLPCASTFVMARTPSVPCELILQFPIGSDIAISFLYGGARAHPVNAERRRRSVTRVPGSARHHATHAKFAL